MAGAVDDSTINIVVVIIIIIIIIIIIMLTCFADYVTMLLLRGQFKNFYHDSDRQQLCSSEYTVELPKTLKCVTQRQIQLSLIYFQFLLFFFYFQLIFLLFISTVFFRFITFYVYS